MASSDKESLIDAIVKYRPPPVNQESAINFYLPAFGTFNYTLLSINVMNPGILQRYKQQKSINHQRCLLCVYNFVCFQNFT